MNCPNCHSEDYKEHLRQPVRYGGRNSVQYYSCNECGVLFHPTRNNPPPPPPEDPRVARLRERMNQPIEVTRVDNVDDIFNGNRLPGEQR